MGKQLVYKNQVHIIVMCAILPVRMSADIAFAEHRSTQYFFLAGKIAAAV